MISIVPTERNPVSCPRDISDAAMERLRQAPFVALQKIYCRCDPYGVVYLRGRVSSLYHREIAQQAVFKVEGVTEVINEIEVA